MTSLEKYKGIPPHAVIHRFLQRRQLSLATFAQSLHENPEQLQAVVDGHSPLSLELAVKIEQVLALEAGSLTRLQQFYEAAQAQRAATAGLHPDLSLLRPVLFWDTDIHSIDWIRYEKAVIQRVFERGNDIEKNEIIRFYGLDKVKAVVGQELPQ